jgi:membrane fusion protein (multidrug efflux system)
MENQEPQKSNKAKTIIIRVVLVLALIAAGIYGYTKLQYSMHHEVTDNAQVEARMVPILPRVAGYIKNIYVDDYSEVKKDSLIAEIDDAELLLQLEEMEADLIQVETDIVTAQASITNAQASLASAKANLQVSQVRKDKAQNDYKRDMALFADNATTQKQLDDTKSNVDVANKQYDATQNEIIVAQTRIGVLDAQLKKAQAQIALKQARINQQKLKISYTKIYAPADGKIGRRGIDVGQFVQAGTPMFTIVNDKQMWVVANFKETQIENIKPGSEAEIKLDAYPDIKITGTIVSFSDATGAKFSLLPPDNATGNFVKVTQRVPVKIEIKDEAKYKDILRAGMSVEISVKH